MPIFEVTVSETVRESVEELHIANRDAYYDVVYEVEAETAEEAEELYYQGERIREEFIDYGDWYDSEYVETLEVVDSECMEETVDSVEEISEDVLRRRAEEAERWSRQWSRMVSGAQAQYAGRMIQPTTPSPTAKPTWEV